MRPPKFLKEIPWVLVVIFIGLPLLIAALLTKSKRSH